MASNPDTSLKGKTAFVTGAAKRLGRAVALALAGQGCNVVVHYNRSSPEVDSLCDEIQQAGVSVWPVQCDFSNPTEVEAVFQTVVSQAGPVDILINNASIFNAETFQQTTSQSICDNMQIHAIAPLILARAMARQGRLGHVVNMLDTRVTVYDRMHVSYHLSKRVLLTLTRMLALELAPDIAVNAVAPGLILPPEGEDESYLQKLSSTNPLHRHGDPSDVVEAILFLLRSRFITGQVIYVDGGYHIKGSYS
jgi:NAD(P)-dependent dehydrogenase (short-subunit alcohol dehydrogenase family)